MFIHQTRRICMHKNTAYFFINTLKGATKVRLYFNNIFTEIEILHYVLGVMRFG